MYLIFLVIAAVITFSQKFASAFAAGISLLPFINNNFSLIFLISIILYIPVLLSKPGKHNLVLLPFLLVVLPVMTAGLSVLLPHQESELPGPDIEPGRFYESPETVIFVDDIRDGILSGVVLNKNRPEIRDKAAHTYRGKYSVSEQLILKLPGTGEEYRTGSQDNYKRFFSFLVGSCSRIAGSMAKSGTADIKGLLIKAFSVITAAVAVSFFFSGGRWPLINYLLSVVFIFVFLRLNQLIQRIPVPGILENISGSFSSPAVFYYMLYMVFFLLFLSITLVSRIIRK